MRLSLALEEIVSWRLKSSFFSLFYGLTDAALWLVFEMNMLKVGGFQCAAGKQYLPIKGQMRPSPPPMLMKHILFRDIAGDD